MELSFAEKALNRLRALKTNQWWSDASRRTASLEATTAAWTCSLFPARTGGFADHGHRS
jgi:hypothetical protein